MISPILMGVGAGIVRTFFGWAKAGEQWSWAKFIRTLLIFAITGGVLGLYIVDPLQVFAMTFLAVPIEDFLNGLYKSGIVEVS